MRATLLALLLVSPFVLVPGPAAACSLLRLVTTSGGDGAYVEQGCYPFPTDGVVTLTITYDPSGKSGSCHFVPLVTVLSTPVPGTGQTYCVPPSGSPLSWTVSVPLGDTGVLVCVGGTCAWVTPYYASYRCDLAGTTTFTDPRGSVITLSCT